MVTQRKIGGKIGRAGKQNEVKCEILLFIANYLKISRKEIIDHLKKIGIINPRGIDKHLNQLIHRGLVNKIKEPKQKGVEYSLNFNSQKDGNFSESIKNFLDLYNFCEENGRDRDFMETDFFKNRISDIFLLELFRDKLFKNIESIKNSDMELIKNIFLDVENFKKEMDKISMPILNNKKNLSEDVSHNTLIDEDLIPFYLRHSPSALNFTMKYLESSIKNALKYFEPIFNFSNETDITRKLFLEIVQSSLQTINQILKVKFIDDGLKGKLIEIEKTEYEKLLKIYNITS